MSQVVEVDENGVLTLGREVLGDAEPHSRYIVEIDGGGIYLRPTEETEIHDTADEWWEKWNALSEAVSAAWKSDKSAIEIISEMRR